MGVSTFQATVPTTAGALMTVPPGPCTVTFSNTGANTVFVGGSQVTVSNGFGIPSGGVPVTLRQDQGTAGTPLFAVCGTAQTLGVMVVTAG
jgi:hypothetical protein